MDDQEFIMTNQELKESVDRSRPWMESQGGVFWWKANANIFPDNFRAYIEKQVPKLRVS